MQRSHRFLLVASAVLILPIVAMAGVYAWLTLFHSCEVEAVKDASDFLRIQLKSYDDVYMSAASGTPDALTYPVTVMQQTLVDTQAMQMPACLRPAQQELIGYMDAVVRAFQAYQAREEESVIRDWLGQSDRHYDKFRRELDIVSQCAPFCIR